MRDPGEIRDLVVAAADGDQEAWNRLVDTHAGLIWSVIRGQGFFGAEAADVFQTVWLRAVEHLHRIREPERFASWVATTARHECSRVRRKVARYDSYADVPEPEPVPDDADAQSRLERDEARGEVLEALERVPPRCRELLRLLAADPPVAYEEIVEILDMPKGSIGPTRQRCLAHLRRAIDEVAG